MQANYQQCSCFAPAGGRQYAWESSIKPGVLRRTMRHVGGQIIVLALVLLDIGSLGFAVVAPICLAPWLAINVTVLVLGSLSWSEDRRMQWESTTAMQRQGEKVRAAEWRILKEQQRKVQREHQDAKRRRCQEKDEREAQKRLQDALRQTQEQLMEAKQRQYQEEKERETRRQQSEQAERVRQAERQRREAEQRWWQAKQQREAQRKRRRERKRVAAQFQTDWWIVLGVAPSASKDEIARKYRHKVKQCHPDRLVGLVPELLQLAEEQTKALNGAYEKAMHARGYARSSGAAI